MYPVLRKALSSKVNKKMRRTRHNYAIKTWLKVQVFSFKQQQPAYTNCNGGVGNVKDGAEKDKMIVGAK